MAVLNLPGRVAISPVGLGGSGGGGGGTPTPGTISTFFNYSTFTVGDPETSEVTDGSLLRDAYAEAKLVSPNGGDRSEFNRMVLLIPPGYYQMDEEFIADAECLDLIGLTGDPKDVVIFISETDLFDGAVKQSAHDIRFKGITFLSERAKGTGLDTEPAAWFPTVSQDSSLFTDCVFKDGGFLQSPGTGWCMRQGTTIAATFYDCLADSNAFGSHGGDFEGVARFCTAGSESFGNEASMSGEVRNCLAGGSSFGGGTAGIVSGFCISCEARGDFSFGGDAVQGGAVLTDCFARSNGNSCFGVSSIGSGARFLNCTSDGANCFASAGHISDAVTFTNCRAGAESFGDEVESSTTFTNCTGGPSSFGKSLFSARAVNCISVGAESFGGLGTFDGELVSCAIWGLNAAWAPPTSMAGIITSVTFHQFGTDEDAVTLCDGATTKFYSCIFRANGTGTPMGIVALGTATVSIAYCQFNTVTGLAVGITNSLGATLVDAFNIGNTSV